MKIKQHFFFIWALLISFTLPSLAVYADTLPVITKNPTSEAIAIGGKTWFIAHADNALSMTWELVDPYGNIYTLMEAMTMNPGLKLQALDGDTIAVSNVPQSVNGWGVQATFYGSAGAVSTSPAYLYVGDFLTAYAPVIQTYRDYIRGVPSSSDVMSEYVDSPLTYYTLPYEAYGVSLMMRYNSDVGYYLKDLNKDGIPELLIGISSVQSYDSYPDATTLYDLFTLSNWQPRRLLASSERVIYKFRSDNMIYNYGSGGASYLTHTIYKYNGYGFDTVRSILSDNGNYSMTQENGVSTPISETQFWQLADEFEAPVIKFAVTPIK